MSFTSFYSCIEKGHDWPRNVSVAREALLGYKWRRHRLICLSSFYRFYPDNFNINVFCILSERFSIGLATFVRPELLLWKLLSMQNAKCSSYYFSSLINPAKALSRQKYTNAADFLADFLSQLCLSRSADSRAKIVVPPP